MAAVDGADWIWPAGEHPASRRHAVDDSVRLLAPFDPIVWDRRRFETFWGWAYRFEAYTPAARRVLGPDDAIRSRFVWVPLAIRGFSFEARAN